MVVYDVFSDCITYKYKAYFCSKASLILFITSVLSVLFPLIFTYRSHGFWMRTDTYQEQPQVSYKYDYILIADTDSRDSLIICSNLPYISTNHYSCPIVKAIEEDVNRDGYNDALHFSINLLSEDVTVHGITLLLFFDYKLTSYCRVQMEVMAVVQHSSPLAGAGLIVSADLSLVQRQPLNPRHTHTQYNISTVQSTVPFSLPQLLSQYSFRNVSARLTNMYVSWQTRPVAGEPFTVDATVIYTESTVRYTPSRWQQLRLGWVQFFPILVISILAFRAVKSFIFSNQLVHTYRDVPWKPLR
ncbi:transmembrane protein 231 isoform X1 [Homalodisca vitripennis]|uniref:transmembrane protein 231 isoform X1 n=2 Tax=Homalodisca vitripennis TaxID=197043 RepID=UPI001EEB505B|nr:transmembrane protein 231 isoform X1 [Homalodisca vitripennis]